MVHHELVHAFPADNFTFRECRTKHLWSAPERSTWISPRTKVFTINERFRIQYRAEFFNLFNHPLFNNPDTSVADSNAFGKITTARSPRIIQMAL